MGSRIVLQDIPNIELRNHNCKLVDNNSPLKSPQFHPCLGYFIPDSSTTASQYWIIIIIIILLLKQISSIVSFQNHEKSCNNNNNNNL